LFACPGDKRKYANKNRNLLKASKKEISNDF